MPLYGTGRDVSLIRRLNRELLDRIIDIEVEFYKLATDYIKTNLYGEAAKKIFFNPVRLNCLIKRGRKQTTISSETLDSIRSIDFRFLRDNLVDANIVLEEGDIIAWDNEYFELKTVSSEQLWTGKNPTTYTGTTTGETPEFGYEIGIVATGHKVRLSSLQLVEVRTGITPEFKLPKNI